MLAGYIVSEISGYIVFEYIAHFVPRYPDIWIYIVSEISGYIALEYIEDLLNISNLTILDILHMYI